MILKSRAESTGQGSEIMTAGKKDQKTSNLSMRYTDKHIHFFMSY